MRLPVRIFSDLHLGHKASRIADVESLRPLFTGAGTVVFNGDTWEEFAEPWRERSLAMLEGLKRILKEEGCDTLFLRGNHDPGWDGRGWLELGDGKIIVTHGDALLRYSSPWKHEILSDAEAVEEVWKKFPDAGTDVECRLAVAREIARRLPSLRYPEEQSLISRIIDAAFPPRRALAMLKAWTGQWVHGAEFCERYFPEAEILVIGHFHCSGLRTLRGRTIINLGSFVVPGKASWAEWNGESLVFGTVRESLDGYSMAPAKWTRKLFSST